MTFGEKLRSLREDKGWTQKALADLASTNQQSVGRWETGEQVPGFDAVQGLCRALGVSCNVFDNCTHEPTGKSRSRGRPKKPGAAATPAKRKKGGA